MSLGRVKLACLAALLGAMALAVVSTQGVSTPPTPHSISSGEAEILIYLLPEAHEIRKAGMEIGWQRETSQKWNQHDFYFFWVYNAMRSEAGSVTVGTFAVNKHTGDIWHVLLQEQVESQEIKGVQRILRRTHGIDDRKLHKYANRPLSAGKPVTGTVK